MIEFIIDEFRLMAEIYATKIWMLLVWNLLFLGIIFGKSTDGENICNSKKYQEQTLKLSHEQAIADSFNDRSTYVK